MPDPAEEQHQPGDLAALWTSARVTWLLQGAPEDVSRPAYGSRAWVQLPPEHPLRYAAVYAAAEAWRRHEREEHRLAALAEANPAAWLREVTHEADTYAARMGRTLAAAPTRDELATRRTPRKTKTVTATPGWPVALPGHAGWWRHCLHGQQVDLPHREAPAAERRATA